MKKYNKKALICFLFFGVSANAVAMDSKNIATDCIANIRNLDVTLANHPIFTGQWHRV